MLAGMRSFVSRASVISGRLGGSVEAYSECSEVGNLQSLRDVDAGHG
jgi:hypothetical protein